jgi:predicted DNA-binding transcriptional regulator YafY
MRSVGVSAVLPIAVIYWVDAVVLAAWCELRQGFRHFRGDRIDACTPLADTFAGQHPALRVRWEEIARTPGPSPSP